MPYPTFSLEYSLLKQGKIVAGMDEVGRGCLAGPVVAAVVVIDDESQFIPGVNDSKKLSAKRRSGYDEQLRQCVADYGIGESSNVEIDEIGITEAVELAMKRAYEGLKKHPEVVLVDGDFINAPWCNNLAIKKGDALHYAISAASVIAKEYRDRLMRGLAVEYPDYGFERHVGYGTAKHRSAIEEHGACEIHRMSFAPLKETNKKFG